MSASLRVQLGPIRRDCRDRRHVVSLAWPFMNHMAELVQQARRVRHCSIFHVDENPAAVLPPPLPLGQPAQLVPDPSMARLSPSSSPGSSSSMTTPP